MKLGYIVHNKDYSVKMEDNIITLGCLNPLIIQPSEIKKAQTGVEFKIPKGYLLNINTIIGLYGRAADIFPSVLTFDHNYSGELFIPIKNSGRNPLNLMPGDSLAQAHVVKIEKIDMQVLDILEVAKGQPPKTRPQKKNDNFKFEVTSDQENKR